MKRLKFVELTTASLADVVITHSSAEAALLREKVPEIRVRVVPWWVPVEPPSQGFGFREGVAFIGNFSHKPNADAAYWLAKEVVPLVQQRDQNISFKIVGRNLPEAMHKLQRPGLEVVGPINDLNAFLRGIRLSIAPLRYGAGLKGKVIESVAAGVPCIGTTIAYEGISLPGSSLANHCIADTPQELACAILELYTDEAAYMLISEEGRAYAELSYGKNVVDDELRHAVAPALHRWEAERQRQYYQGPLARSSDDIQRYDKAP